MWCENLTPAFRAFITNFEEETRVFAVELSYWEPFNKLSTHIKTNIYAGSVKIPVCHVYR